MSGELSLAVKKEQLDLIESITSQCSLEAIGNDGHFVRAMRLAAGVNALRKAITHDIMRELMSLQGSPLGFRTDKDSGDGYKEEIVKECAIEVLLRGGHWVGNEFNIIAGRAYLTKEFFTRKLREFPGLTDLRLFPGVPHMANGGALVPYSATWKLNGVPGRIDRMLTKQGNDGPQIDERICVRVNAGMGADAILGKAERKIKAAIYSRITGTEFTDGEADESAQSRPLPTTLDDLAARLAGPVTTKAPADEAGDLDEALLDEARAAFDACTEGREVAKAQEIYRTKAQTEAERTAVNGLADDARARLKPQKQKELAGA